MRFALALGLLASATLACAQADLWKSVSTDPNSQQLSDAKLSSTRMEAIHKLLRKSVSSIGWTCEGDDDLNELLKGLTFKEIPLSDNQKVLLAEAGAGCARGGQGSNGAMWLIRFDHDTPALIATPKDDFSGWLYSIQPTARAGT